MQTSVARGVTNPPTSESQGRHDSGLSQLRVRGLVRVQLHADLCMLAQLAQAFAEREPFRSPPKPGVCSTDCALAGATNGGRGGCS
jgi:hypothetical protein